MSKQIKNPSWIDKKNGDQQDAAEFNEVVAAVKTNAEVQAKQLRVDATQNFNETEKAQGLNNLGLLEYFNNFITKLDSENPESEFLLRADGTRVNQQTLYIEIKNQFNNAGGHVDLDLITEEGTYVLKEPRDEDLNNLPHYGGDGASNVQIDLFKAENYTMQRAIYYSYTQGKPTIAYRVKPEGGVYGDWVDAYKEDYNGVSPAITANIAETYNIYVKEKAQHYNLTMTDDTDINFLEMIAANQTKVITITLSGDFAFTFPGWLKSLETNDEYDTIEGSLTAEIVINIKNGGTTPQGYYSLQMIDYAL